MKQILFLLSILLLNFNVFAQESALIADFEASIKKAGRMGVVRDLLANDFVCDPVSMRLIKVTNRYFMRNGQVLTNAAASNIWSSLVKTRDGYKFNDHLCKDLLLTNSGRLVPSSIKGNCVADNDYAGFGPYLRSARACCEKAGCETRVRSERRRLLDDANSESSYRAPTKPTARPVRRAQ